MSTTQQTTLPVTNAVDAVKALTAMQKPESNVHQLVKTETKAKSLSAKQQKVSAENKRLGNIGDALQQVGETIGYYSVETDMLKADVRLAVEEHLKFALSRGLTVEMLKAPSSKNPGECWTAIVDALQGVRESAGLDPLKDSTRDNYLSRIRNFVRDRAANPLDLFGNFAVKKAKGAGEKSSLQSEKSQDEEVSTNTEQEVPASPDAGKQFAGGVPALYASLKNWSDSNDAGMVAEKYRKMVADLMGMIEAELGEFIKKSAK